jgi:hypothetical protein
MDLDAPGSSGNAGLRALVSVTHGPTVGIGSSEDDTIVALHTVRLIARRLLADWKRMP